MNSHGHKSALSFLFEDQGPSTHANKAESVLLYPSNIHWQEDLVHLNQHNGHQILDAVCLLGSDGGEMSERKIPSHQSGDPASYDASTFDRDRQMEKSKGVKNF